MMDATPNYPPGFVFRFEGDDLTNSLVYTTEPTTNYLGGGIRVRSALMCTTTNVPHLA